MVAPGTVVPESWEDCGQVIGRIKWRGESPVVGRRELLTCSFNWVRDVSSAVRVGAACLASSRE